MGKIVHFSVLVYYVCVDYHIFTYALPRVMNNIIPIYENRFLMPVQMGTLWLQVIQQVYFLGCFIDDLLDFRMEAKIAMTPLHTKLRNLTNQMFSTCVFPLTISTSLNFWLMFAYDPTYIDGHKALFDIISRESNHLLHTAVVILVFIEIATNYTHYPEKLTDGLRTVTWITVAYVMTVLILQPYTSIWVYPFIEVFTRNELIVFVLGNLLFLYVLYIAGLFINKAIWGNQEVRLKKL